MDMTCRNCGSDKHLSAEVAEFDNVVIKEIYCAECKGKETLIDCTKKESA